MNPIFAAGLFDSPWLVAAIIIGGALVNWLSQRREKQKQRNEGEAPPEPPSKAEFDVEGALRRLLGEPPPPPTPAPPPVPGATQNPGPPPPVIRHRERASRPSTVRVPPPVVGARPVQAKIASSVAASARTTQHHALTRQKPATVLGHRSRVYRTDLWQDRKSLRRAFVASLIFGPPKGLES